MDNFLFFIFEIFLKKIKKLYFIKYFLKYNLNEKHSALDRVFSIILIYIYKPNSVLKNKKYFLKISIYLGHKLLYDSSDSLQPKSEHGLAHM